MDNVQFDLLTVAIAAVLNMVIGFFWYSKWLFGPVWLRLSGMEIEKEHNKMSLLYALIVSLVIAYFLAFFEAYMGVTTVTDGMLVGFFSWLGFVATTQINGVIWGNKTFKGFLIESGCKLLSFLVMGGVIGA